MWTSRSCIINNNDKKFADIGLFFEGTIDIFLFRNLGLVSRAEQQIGGAKNSAG
ncbi:hypothetical protein Ngar_c06080 [Candidatus Nitrososphaera gargensis Ga9.2]|uniref:Uncharacterized protein n=1 Tax=Nitrososphaera gargensis (strain Ga9.2) TaxID=1237085 RepID=K0I8E6_NITGG|nr:hypothetical protein Ngar_c06080 [Candidatus Nitrososphaera gargensis Ga9.2]